MLMHPFLISEKSNCILFVEARGRIPRLSLCISTFPLKNTVFIVLGRKWERIKFVILGRALLKRFIVSVFSHRHNGDSPFKTRLAIPL